MIRFKKIIVGISGGVDSAVAALLLKKKGYDVQGVYMKNWDLTDETGICTSEQDYKDVEIICDKLDIPVHAVNFVKEYWNEVFSNLIHEYENGRTPNPDVQCNRFIKFKYFYKHAIEKLGGDAIATGHYARSSFGPYLEDFDENKKAKLMLPRDIIKDQTFFLCQISQNALRKTMFPLGDLIKSEVKQIAIENNLEKIAQKKESMGICFIGTRNFKEFISEYIKNKPGNFIDVDTGKIVGQHNGIHQWTLGQRSKIQGVPDAYFIAKKDIATNTIYVAMGTKHPLLHGRMFGTSKPHWISEKPLELEEGNILNCEFTFQHTQDLVDCQVVESPNGLIVRLREDKRALTEGQYAVFYKGEECLGSAMIESVSPSRFTLDWTKNKKDKINTEIQVNKKKVKQKQVNT